MSQDQPIVLDPTYASFDAAARPADLGATHFIGIGGAGMSVLAEMLHAEGVAVDGSDRAHSAKTDRLETLGITVEFLAYRPLRQAPPLAVLITAIGVSYLLQNLALLIYGSEQKAFPVLFTIPSVELGGMYIDGITIATMAVTAIIMVGLSLFINRTRMGKAMRAVSEDKEAAELMGISVNRTITVTFAIGSALAGVAAIFYGAAYTYIRPTTGAMPGIKAFTAAVFGGIGSIPGAMLGGVLLGVIEQLSKTYISTLWADAIVFGVLVAVLVVKPTGLLGKRISEKV